MWNRFKLKLQNRSLAAESFDLHESHVKNSTQEIVLHLLIPFKNLLAYRAKREKKQDWVHDHREHHIEYIY